MCMGGTEAGAAPSAGRCRPEGMRSAAGGSVGSLCTPRGRAGCGPAQHSKLWSGADSTAGIFTGQKSWPWGQYAGCISIPSLWGPDDRAPAAAVSTNRVGQLTELDCNACGSQTMLT